MSVDHIQDEKYRFFVPDKGEFISFVIEQEKKYRREFFQYHGGSEFEF
jgi:hypothetical protein